MRRLHAFIDFRAAFNIVKKNTLFLAWEEFVIANRIYTHYRG
jgi:hypothetical protein